MRQVSAALAQPPQGRPLVAVVTFGPILAAANSGSSSRARRIVDDLVAIGYDVTVLSVGDVKSRKLQFHGHEVQAVGFPGPVRLGVSAGLVKATRRLAERADAILVCSAQLLPAVRAARLKLPVIWDAHEFEYLHYRRLPRTLTNQLKRTIWWILERWSCSYADAVVAISKAEAAKWRWIYPSCSRKLCVVNHSPGSEWNRPSLQAPAEEHRASPARLLFVGNLLAKHNLEAAGWIVRDLAPLMTGKAHLVLVGPGTESLEVDPRLDATVTCLGEVDNLATVLGTAAFALAPLLSGAGVKTKVLDYVASGLRVVGTPLAFEGIEDCPGLISTSLEGMPAVIERLLSRNETDAERAERCGLQRQWLQERCHPAVTRAQWLAAFSQVGLAPISAAPT